MKNDIDRIDEQIKDIVDTNKESSQDKTIPIDKTLINNEQDTKRLDSIEDIELLEEEEKPKEIKVQMPTIQPLEAQKEEPQEELVEEAKQEENNSNKKSLTLIVALCIVVLSLGILIALLIANKNNNKKTEQAKNESDKNTILQKYGDAVSEIISMNYMKKNTLLSYEEASKLVYFKEEITCDEYEVYEDGSLYLNECVIDNEEVDASYGKKKQKKETPTPSGNVKIYVLKGSGLATLKVPQDGTNYITYSIDIKENYTNLELLNDKSSDFIYYISEDDYTSHIINFKTGEKVLKNVSYTSIAPIRNDNEYDTRYAAVNITKDGYSKWGFYDMIDNKEVVQPQFYFTNWGCTSGPTTVVNAINGKIAVNTINGNDTNSIRYGVIDYTNGKYSVPIEYKTMWNIEGYLFCTTPSNKSFIYDYEGKKYLDNKIDKVEDALSKDYILIRKDKEIELLNIDGKILYKYGEYELKGNYNSYRTKNGAIFIFKIESTSKDKQEDKENNETQDETVEETPKETVKDQCIKFTYYEDSKTGKVEEGTCEELSKEE